MSKRLNISQARKEEIKTSFNKLRKSELTGDEKRYYVLIENGKRSAKNNVRFHGRYLSGEIVDIARKVAKRKNLSLDDYLDEHREAVDSLIEHGFTQTDKKPDNVIDLIANQRRKTIELETGNGIVKMTKSKAIQYVSLFQQFAASNTNIVQLGLNTKVFTNNKIRIVLPLPEEFEGMTEDEFIDLLDELGIWYVQSAKAK